MTSNWKSREIGFFLRAWEITEGNCPNKLITAALKTNSFSRSVAEIEREKNELIRSYALLQPHLETLDIIFKSGKKHDDIACEKPHIESSGNINAKDTKLNKERSEKSANNHSPNTSQSSNGEVVKDETNRKPGENASKIKTQMKPYQTKGSIFKFHNKSVFWHGEIETNCRFAHPELEQNPPLTQQTKQPHLEKSISEDKPAEKMARQKSYADAVQVAVVEQQHIDMN
ncbi:Hypothetical predicted protein [Octopus vulgaris]|uniref:Uncharacterized protein n=1 Tax=Octopus vulgaris TaxID=6645 RepID=A0AA36F9C8_OCTVU|nr:Hypothetical predicted protein [Octopus vulgaris]